LASILAASQLGTGVGSSVSTIVPTLPETSVSKTTDISAYAVTSEIALPDLLKKMSLAKGIDPKLVSSIAECESRTAQYDKNGEVLRGHKNPSDVGIFQINEKYHLEKSQELEFDIYTPVGNIGYAMWLLEHQGSTPWKWSRDCWSANQA